MKEYPWVTVQGQAPSKSNTYKVITLNGHGSLAKLILLATASRVSRSWH